MLQIQFVGLLVLQPVYAIKQKYEVKHPCLGLCLVSGSSCLLAEDVELRRFGVVKLIEWLGCNLLDLERDTNYFALSGSFTNTELYSSFGKQ